jgi:transposase
MFTLSSSNRFFLYQEPTDMRKGFDSLSGLIRNKMKADPLDGAVYIFMNKNRTLIKLLHWDKTGFTLYYKRLERGVFERPVGGQNSQISRQKLMLIVSGIRLDSVRKKVRYKLVKK